MKRDTAKRTALGTPRQEPTRADASESLIPDDAPLSSSDLPPDFWSDAADTAPSEPPRRDALGADAASAREPSVPMGASDPDHEASSSEAATPAATLSTAFDELVSLFPGRVIEVISHAEEAAAPIGDALTPLDDELLDHDGYDDDDQDRLTFGASRNV